MTYEGGRGISSEIVGQRTQPPQGIDSDPVYIQLKGILHCNESALISPRRIHMYESFTAFSTETYLSNHHSRCHVTLARKYFQKHITYTRAQGACADDIYVFIVHLTSPSSCDTSFLQRGTIYSYREYFFHPLSRFFYTQFSYFCDAVALFRRVSCRGLIFFVACCLMITAILQT